MVFTFFCTTNCSLVFLNGSFSNPIWVRTPWIHGSPIKPPFNVTSFLIPLGTDTKGMQSCTNPDPTLAPFMKGAIVMVVMNGGCSVNKHALVAQNAGASAVLVLIRSTFMFAALSQKDPDPSVLKVPVIFIDADDFVRVISPALQRKEMVIIKVEGDPSELDLFNKGGILFHSIFLSLFSLVGLGLMTYKLIEFIKSKTYTVALGVFSCVMVACIANMLYLPDPWGFWHRISSFPYEIIVLNFTDLFQVISILLVTFHLSHVMLRATTYHKYVIISYIISSFIILGYVIVIIVDVSFQLTYSFGKITPNSLQWFRLSVFILCAFYFITCDIIFIKRLVSLFDITSQGKEKKKTQYKKLIGSTSFIGFVILYSIVLRALVLHTPFMIDPKFLLSIQAINATIAPCLAISYFSLFKIRQKQRSKSESNNSLNDPKKFIKLDNEN